MPFLSLHLVVEMDTTDKLPAVTLWRWTGEWRPGEKGARGGGGYRRREKRRREARFQGGGKREKKGKITRHCEIFRNRKNAKRREPINTGRKPGLKGTGGGRFNPIVYRPKPIAPTLPWTNIPFTGE